MKLKRCSHVFFNNGHLVEITQALELFADRYTILVGSAMSVLKLNSPDQTPEPTIAGEKREPSSLVQTTSSSGLRVVWFASLSARTTSSPARTPYTPSKFFPPSAGCPSGTLDDGWERLVATWPASEQIAPCVNANVAASLGTPLNE
ncbi:MAG: hypothetical protein Ct9H300mP8_04120 [Gammaproteobacteria bacterium]|nr:MAG: hypothetical protein Ct9H300mP8_04120 [Gammaproteobacteria bacterium]